MEGEKKERWLELCAQAAVEQDSGNRCIGRGNN
jgi:hypothetical protein